MTPLIISSLLTLTLLILPSSQALTTSFPSFSSITECGTANIGYSGGSGVTRLLTMAVWGSTTVTTLDPKGFPQMAYPINYAAGTQLVFTIEDDSESSTSRVYTVQPNLAGDSCTLKTDTEQFYFTATPANPVQCQPLRFNWTTSFTETIYLFAVVPSGGGGPGLNSNGDGEVYRAETNRGDRVFTWDKVTIPSGTQVLLAAMSTDYQSQGGVSGLYTVGSSNDNSCLSSSTPNNPSSSPTTSVAVATTAETTTPTQTQSRAGGGVVQIVGTGTNPFDGSSVTGTGTVSSGVGSSAGAGAATSSTPSSSKSLSAGAIAGIAIAAVVGVVILVLLIVLLKTELRRRRGWITPSVDHMSNISSRVSAYPLSQVAQPSPPLDPPLPPPPINNPPNGHPNGNAIPPISSTTYNRTHTQTAHEIRGGNYAERIRNVRNYYYSNGRGHHPPPQSSTEDSSSRPPSMIGGRGNIHEERRPPSPVEEQEQGNGNEGTVRGDGTYTSTWVAEHGSGSGGTGPSSAPFSSGYGPPSYQGGRR